MKRWANSFFVKYSVLLFQPFEAPEVSFSVPPLEESIPSVQRFRCNCVHICLNMIFYIYI